MNSETPREFNKAAIAYRAGDSCRWRFAFYASRIVRNSIYGSKASLTLANAIGGVGVDTIEQYAKAFRMYSDLRGEYGAGVRFVRRSKVIYISHFVVLANKRNKYGLTLQECWSYLGDVYQAEGDISSRDLATLIDDDKGIEHTLSHDARKAKSALYKVLNRLDLSTEQRKVLRAAFDVLEVMAVAN
jgi:hypothetical protein